MNVLKIMEVEKEAEKVLGIIIDIWGMIRSGELKESHLPCGFGTKETAALRRASMDLTRALAKMRKSG